MKVRFAEATHGDRFPDLDALAARLAEATAGEREEIARAALAYARYLESGLLALTAGEILTPKDLEARLEALATLAPGRGGR
jgi:hypothetical protein